jgi:hypothetical protein
LTEAQHQAALFNWVWLVRNKYPELALLHHIPNGGSRNCKIPDVKQEGEE